MDIRTLQTVFSPKNITAGFYTGSPSIQNKSMSAVSVKISRYKVAFKNAFKGVTNQVTYWYVYLCIT